MFTDLTFFLKYILGSITIKKKKNQIQIAVIIHFISVELDLKERKAVLFLSITVGETNSKKTKYVNIVKCLDVFVGKKPYDTSHISQKSEG